jgi:N-acetylmuramoyl-L-alanine amidase
MSTRYVVKQGDYLAKIARAHGYTDYNALWNAPENQGLRAKRKSPNVLFPGDEVVIPDAAEKCDDGSTGQRHRYVLKESSLKLRLDVEDAFRSPVRESDCQLDVSGVAEKKHRTDGDGRLELVIPKNTERARLVFREADTAFEGVVLDVSVGGLDPIDEIEGQAQRLVNLGYLQALVLDPEDPAFLSAVQEFQCDHGVGVDGRCGPVTQARLERVHGA